MTIFAVSDIHSFFTPMKKALDEAGFELGNPEHLLVVCGDLFDRGEESQQVLDYMLSVPNKVIVKGNHSILLEECCERGYPLSHDWHNGTANTILSLAPEEEKWDVACAIAYNKVKPLLDIEINYYETVNFIFVHSWVPSGKDWRYATQSKWDKAMWDNPFDIAGVVGNKTEKIIVHGHWHNSYWWSNHGVGSEFGSDACFNICEHDGCIGLDGCVAYSDQCNVLVLQDDLLT